MADWHFLVLLAPLKSRAKLLDGFVYSWSTEAESNPELKRPPPCAVALSFESMMSSPAVAVVLFGGGKESTTTPFAPDENCSARFDRHRSYGCPSQEAEGTVPTLTEASEDHQLCFVS